MKRMMMLAAALMLGTTLLYAAEPESKMEKSFREMFPNAQNVKWHQDAKSYLVSFTQSGTPVKIVYDNKGKFIQSLRYYNEKDLPTNILLAVKNKYHGKTIYGVTECTTSSDVTYHIVLFDGGTPENLVATSDGSVKAENAAEEAPAE